MRIKGTLLAAILISAYGCGGDEERGPNAKFTVECVEFACNFDAGSTTSQLATRVQFQWDFGDGETASGAKATHYYENSGDFEVTLLAVDPYGRDEAVKTVSATGNDALAFFEPTRNSISTMMLIAESSRDFILSGDLVQAKAETVGVPGEDGYDLSCVNDSNVIKVVSWNDSNTNALIDQNESLEIIPQGCEVNDQLYLSSANSVGLTGDFDANTFSVVTPAEFGFGVSTEAYRNWYTRGTLNFNVTRTNGNIDTAQVQSDSFYLLQRDNENVITKQVFGNMSLEYDFDSASQVLGNIIFGESFGATAPSNNVQITTALEFDYSGDQPALLQGEFSLERGTAIATISVDADPAYLSIEIDEDGDGVIDISERYPQSLAVIRWQ